MSEWSFRIVPRCLKITLTHWHDCDENGSFQRAHSLYIWGFKGVVIILDLRGISTRLVTVGHSAKSPKSSVLTPNWILIPFYLICFVNIHRHVPSLRHFWRSWFFYRKTARKNNKTYRETVSLKMRTWRGLIAEYLQVQVALENLPFKVAKIKPFLDMRVFQLEL